jgi:hypothetical protein
VTEKEHQRTSRTNRQLGMIEANSESCSTRIYHNAIRLVPWVRRQFSIVQDFTNCPNSSILGPSLGGALAQPCVNYPGLFPPGTIFEKFPYLLPNLVCTVVVLCGLMIGILFLEETHSEKKHRRDPGLEAGRWILSKIRRCANPKASKCEKATNLLEVQSLIDNKEQLPGYRTTEGSPQLPSTPSPDAEELLSLDLNEVGNTFLPTRQKPAIATAFTRQVVLNIVGYGILA